MEKDGPVGFVEAGSQYVATLDTVFVHTGKYMMGFYADIHS